MLIKESFHTDEGAKLQGLFKREQMNESVIYRHMIPSNCIKTVLQAVFMYINRTFLVAKVWVQIHHFQV